MSAYCHEKFLGYLQTCLEILFRYVMSVFDTYSDAFEANLVGDLGYVGHLLVVESVINTNSKH